MKIYMIGIGGIGMSALAQLYFSEGYAVSGSDREASPVTRLLEKKGIKVFLEQKAENIPKDANVIVYSDAVWEDNPERARTKELGLRQVSYFEALGEISKKKYTIAVTGTNGKTTTTAILAQILKDSGKEPTAIIGSLVSEFGSNFIEGKSNLFIVEGCEYRDHVLKLSPTILVLTNIEWDHTDWFPSLEAVQEMFGEAILSLPKEGALITDPQHPHIAPLVAKAKCKVIDYTKEIAPKLQLIGEFNKMNARAAIATAKAYDSSLDVHMLNRIVSEFKGTWRRFEYKGKTKEGAVVYDDYAHHPSAIHETLIAATEKFPNKKIAVAFHPHLYSRTRDLMDEFAVAFTGAAEVLVAPVYAARENPIPGVNAEVLAQKITAQGIPARGFASLEDVHKSLKELSISDRLILTMGAGDIYKIADMLVS